jgi:hypothetical protein
MHPKPKESDQPLFISTYLSTQSSEIPHAPHHQPTAPHFLRVFQSYPRLFSHMTTSTPRVADGSSTPARWTLLTRFRQSSFGSFPKAVVTLFGFVTAIQVRHRKSASSPSPPSHYYPHRFNTDPTTQTPHHNSFDFIAPSQHALQTHFPASTRCLAARSPAVASGSPTHRCDCCGGRGGVGGAGHGGGALQLQLCSDLPHDPVPGSKMGWVPLEGKKGTKGLAKGSPHRLRCDLSFCVANLAKYPACDSVGSSSSWTRSTICGYYVTGLCIW